MFDKRLFENLNEEKKLKTIKELIRPLISGEESNLTKLCNATALINALLEDVNWCGFYLNIKGELVLGPFQGMPACTKIQVGKGVCGVAAEKREIIRVDNVHDFEGHIACDAASNSEIVLPIIQNNNLCGVLDIDSSKLNRFKVIHEKELKEIVDILMENIDFELIIKNMI